MSGGRKDRKSETFQRELYDLHYRRIYNTCLRIAGNVMDAEETADDVFMKLFDRLDDLRDEQAFVSWSQKIAIRMSIDRVRKKKPVFEQVNDLTEVEEEEDEATEYTVEAIKYAMERLPDGYRMVLSMRLFEEMEFEDIAQELRIKTSTVRSQYVRGRSKLADFLRNG